MLNMYFIFSAVLMFGTNNLALGHEGRESETPIHKESPESICKRLTQAVGKTFVITAREMRTMSGPASEGDFSNKTRALGKILSNLPFGKNVFEEIPEALKLQWHWNGQRAFTEFLTKEGSLIVVFVDQNGLVEIKVGSLSSLQATEALHARVIAVFKKSEAEAMFRTTGVLLPQHPEDPTDLNITRLDANDKKVRSFVNYLIYFLLPEELR